MPEVIFSTAEQLIDIGAVIQNRIRTLAMPNWGFNLPYPSTNPLETADLHIQGNIGSTPTISESIDNLNNGTEFTCKKATTGFILPVIVPQGDFLKAVSPHLGNQFSTATGIKYVNPATNNYYTEEEIIVAAGLDTDAFDMWPPFSTQPVYLPMEDFAIYCQEVLKLCTVPYYLANIRVEPDETFFQQTQTAYNTVERLYSATGLNMYGESSVTPFTAPYSKQLIVDWKYLYNNTTVLDLDFPRIQAGSPTPSLTSNCVLVYTNPRMACTVTVTYEFSLNGVVQDTITQTFTKPSTSYSERFYPDPEYYALETYIRNWSSSEDIYNSSVKITASATIRDNGRDYITSYMTGNNWSFIGLVNSNIFATIQHPNYYGT